MTTPAAALAVKPPDFWSDDPITTEIPGTPAMDDPIVDVIAISNGSPYLSRSTPALHASVNARYSAYQHWCERIGVPFASFEEWERINRQISEGAGLSRNLAPKKASKRKLTRALLRLSALG